MIRFISNSMILLMLFVCLPTKSWAVPQKVSALWVEGDVRYREPGSTVSKKLVKGSILSEGTLVRTGANSSCEIAMDGSKSVVRMKENSQTTLPAIDREKVRVDLEEGKVMVWLRDLPKGSSFQVSSPTAVATSRGTGWEQGVDVIQVFEHNVEVAGAAGDSMIVEEGQGLGFEADGLGEPFEVPQDAREEWDSFQAEADKHIVEDVPAASTEPTGESDKTAEGDGETAEEAPEDAAGENAFDGFDNSFETVEEDGGMDEALSEAQEQTADTEEPPEFDDDEDDDDGCVSQSGYPC